MAYGGFRDQLGPLPRKLLSKREFTCEVIAPAIGAFRLDHPVVIPSIYIGSDVETSNMRLDLLAVVAGLRTLDAPSELRVCMSSDGAIRLAAEWCKKSPESYSLNMRGLPNEQLLLELRTLAQRHNITWYLGAELIGVSIGDGFPHDKEQEKSDHENESTELQAL